MMLIDNTFELNIPTHISFTLYKFDYIDGIIISRVLRECKNWNETNPNLYTVNLDEFKTAVLGNLRLKGEVLKANSTNLVSSPDLKPNSIHFLWYIMSMLPNLSWLTFNISNNKKFSRLVNIDNKPLINFHFKITEGIFDLTKIYRHDDLDIINKKIIEIGIMPNKYLERSPYFYMKTSALFEILTQLEMDGLLDTFDLLDKIDPKLEEDDPILLIITDYTPY